MARYEHLPLRRLEGQLERRKHGGGQPPKRDARGHGASIEAELTSITESQRARPQIAGIDASLILKIKTAGPIDQADWARVGLTVIAADPDKTLILFANDAELAEFRRRVLAYQEDPPEGQKGHQYSGFVDAIEAVSEIEPEDRIGPVLRAEGIDSLERFAEGREVYDLELWQVGIEKAVEFITRVSARLVEHGGTVISEYRGVAAALMRIEADGTAVRGILDLPEILSIDRPPLPDLPDDYGSEGTTEDIGEIQALLPDSATIGVIDSGLASGHPLIESAVRGAFGVPESLGDYDDKGHGTPISGIATYGDIRARIEAQQLQPQFGIASVRVVGADGRFPAEELVPKQMDVAIRRLHGEFGCRVINISLGDMLRPAGRKASAWAATLDNLARELDIVIVVSAGNTARSLLDRFGDGVVEAYPQYLRDEENRLLEPATAANVLSVGSLAHSNGLSEEDGDYVGVRPIAGSGEPSPFTRIGPGIGKIMKPDFADFGGTAVFDGPTQQVVDGKTRAGAGIVSLNSRYVERLLKSYCGTSFASALVAHKAGIVTQAFPAASANLVRALMAVSADIPDAARMRMRDWDDEDVARVVGNGLANVEFALNSDDNRVILVREDNLPLDRFALYEVPIPANFQTEHGLREIRVALAFMPPVRHTRYDYCGASMSFRLLRGANAEDVFRHCRKWERKVEGQPFKLPPRLDCKLTPGPQLRDSGTLQCATFSAKSDMSKYGNQYFLAVRCESGWATDIESLDFSVAIQLRHEAQIALYQRIEERVRIRA
jgi:subtilisin family serine protease